MIFSVVPQFSSSRFLVKFIVSVLLVSLPAAASDFQGATHLVPIDEEGISYTKAEPDSALSRLKAEMDSGKITLDYDDQHGYLPALLKHLKIPVSSQMLVFSKTSLQRERISPENPRAIFFNDDVYIGWIPGAPLIEISVADPKMGAVFYSIKQEKELRPKFQRTDQCLECHASTKTMGVPGHLVRSFETDSSGIVDLISGTSMVNHRTPFEERWGGWYVTGTHGDQPHRGNLIGKEAHEKHAEEPGFGGNVTNLDGYFQTSKYLSGHSDIVALMVLEHQTHMHNFITRLNYETTLALKTYGHVKYLRSIVDGFVRYMLFADEAELSGKVQGTAQFQKEFASMGPRDSKGRSLRDFDLETRLFKYPCSFLIYSEAFAALPAEIKEKVYDRMFEVLSGEDTTEAYARLNQADRTAILEILRETVKDLPASWHNQVASSGGN